MPVAVQHRCGLHGLWRGGDNSAQTHMLTADGVSWPGSELLLDHSGVRDEPGSKAWVELAVRPV